MKHIPGLFKDHFQGLEFATLKFKCFQEQVGSLHSVIMDMIQWDTPCCRGMILLMPTRQAAAEHNTDKVLTAIDELAYISTTSIIIFISARYNIYISRLCYDVRVRLSVFDGSALAHYS